MTFQSQTTKGEPGQNLLYAMGLVSLPAPLTPMEREMEQFDSQAGFDFDRVTYSPVIAQRAKEQGMELAAEAGADILELARKIARAHARIHGEVTSDDVMKELLALGYRPDDLGNAAGSVFRGEFVWTGRLVPSERVSRHGNMIRVWKLKNN